MPNESSTRYDRLIEEVFHRHYRAGVKRFEVERSELEAAAKKLGLSIKNLGDNIYSYRFRKKLPHSIMETAPEGLTWLIKLAGRARYLFVLGREAKIVARMDLVETKIPDATPEIIERHAMNDEQALLARVRYNRLIDIFTGTVAYSLQNHLRTAVEGVGQLEVDEIYVAVNRKGEQFVIPVQAKVGRDSISSVQAEQDIQFCRARYPLLTCRAISVQQSGRDQRIAMFELLEEGGEIKVAAERHYRLVPASEISEQDLRRMSKN